MKMDKGVDIERRGPNIMKSMKTGIKIKQREKENKQVSQR